MVDAKIVKPIGNLDVPFKQKPDGTLYTFDPAISPASGTSTAVGTPTTLIDNTRTEATNHWNGQLLLITSGVNIGQIREIVTWNLPAFTFTVAPAFEVAVAAGITYQVIANLAADIETAAIQTNLGAIADVEAEAGSALARLLWIKEGIRRGAGTILPAGTSLYDQVLTRAAPGAAMALTAAERLTVQALILTDVTPFAGANIALIKTQTDKIPRILCSMDFWSAEVVQFILTGAAQANFALNANVVIAGLPAGVTLVRVVVMFMCRNIENTNALANGLQGAQNIQVNFAAGAYLSAIALLNNQFAMATTTVQQGAVLVGNVDVKATVTGNGTCAFQIDSARALQNNLTFNDYQLGVRVYFTI